MRIRHLLVTATLALGAAACDDCKHPPAADAEADAGAPDGAVVNATPLPAASIAAMVNPDHLPPYSGPTGSVEGVVSVVGDAPPAVQADFSRCPDAQKTWGTEFREGPETDAGARALADAVVVITGYKGFFIPEKNEAKTIDIVGCAYERRTVTLTFGQRLEVKNRTNDFWTPILEPTSRRVMMMASPNGDPVRIYPKKWGRHLLVDHDRAYVGVDVFVFFHPLHTTTDLAGRYRIDGLPVGKVQVNATHPRFDGASTVDLDVREGVVQRVDLTLHYTRPDAGPAAATAEAGARPPLH